MWQSQNHQIAWLDGSGEPGEVAAAAPSDVNAPVSGIVGIGGEDAVERLNRTLSETKLSLVPNGKCSSPMTENGHNIQNDPQVQTMARNFAMEHRIFLRAIMELLTERDHMAMEADVNGPNTIKIGSLRKSSHRIKGLWKTKYVEIRKGTFSYFDDNAKQRGNSNAAAAASINSGRDLLRKDIPLRASSCTCRAVKIRSVKILASNSGGAVFELRIQGGSRRLWMANTREERQAWIQAIHNAMVGASITRGENFLEYQAEHGSRPGKKSKSNVPLKSPHRTNLEQYLEVRSATHRAESKHQYLDAFSCIRGHRITVPVQWVKFQLDDTPAAASFVETEISSSVEQLWKDLLRDSVEINGEVLAGESFHGPDRIVGNLTQQILSSDASLEEDCKSNPRSGKHTRISDAQAIAYARDILLASDRTRSGGDSYFCAENLCLNRNLAVLVPSSLEAKPLAINVAKCTEDHGMTEISGWVFARASSGKQWKRQYLVLSHCVLSCFAEADPKPHGLLEQVMIYGTVISISSNPVQRPKFARTTADRSVTGKIVKIATKDDRVVREYLFEDEYDFLLWYESLKKSAHYLDEIPCQKMANAKDTNGLRDRPSDSCAQPAVDVLITVCTEYKLCTMDPTGVEGEDTWAELRTTFIQKFSLTGGPKGRISRGDEVVQLEMV